jgi:hypothetical protein
MNINGTNHKIERMNELLNWLRRSKPKELEEKLDLSSVDFTLEVRRKYMDVIKKEAKTISSKMDEVEKILNDFQFLDAFGYDRHMKELDELFFVYYKLTEKYYLFRLHYEYDDDFLEIKNIDDTDPILKRLLGSPTEDEFDDYYQNRYLNQPIVPFEELKIEELTKEQFEYEIWGVLCSELFKTKKHLLKRIREEKRQLN